MQNTKICRDGSFVVIFRGKMSNWQEMEFLLGLREDNYSELLGGGFDPNDLSPALAASREVHEEAGFFIKADELTFFANMIQKLYVLGPDERGYVFYFYKKITKQENNLAFLPSDEHKEIKWHKLSEIFKEGESSYKTSTLRAIIHFLNFLRDKKVRLGILGDKVSFEGYRF